MSASVKVTIPEELAEALDRKRGRKSRSYYASLLLADALAIDCAPRKRGRPRVREQDPEEAEREHLIEDIIGEVADPVYQAAWRKRVMLAVEAIEALGRTTLTDAELIALATEHINANPDHH